MTSLMPEECSQLYATTAKVSTTSASRAELSGSVKGSSQIAVGIIGQVVARAAVQGASAKR